MITLSCPFPTSSVNVPPTAYCETFCVFYKLLIPITSDEKRSLINGNFGYLNCCVTLIIPFMDSRAVPQQIHYKNAILAEFGIRCRMDCFSAKMLWPSVTHLVPGHSRNSLTFSGSNIMPFMPESMPRKSISSLQNSLFLGDSYK